MNNEETRWIEYDDLVDAISWEHDNMVWELTDRALERLHDEAVVIEHPIPKKHGYWIESCYQHCNIDFSIDSVPCIICSECNKYYDKYSKSNYCPNCGTKMNLEAGNE